MYMIGMLLCTTIRREPISDSSPNARTSFTIHTTKCRGIFGYTWGRSSPLEAFKLPRINNSVDQLCGFCSET